MRFIRGQLLLLIQRLLLLFLIYFVLRLLFLIIYYPSFQLGDAKDWLMVFLTSLRFDTSAILLSNAPFILLSLLPFPFFYHRFYQLMLMVVYAVINVFFIFANCVDLVFYGFVRKRMTADIFEFISIGDDTRNVLPALLRDYWYIIVLCLALSALLLYLYHRIRMPVSYHFSGIKSKAVYVLSGLVIAFLFSGVAVIGARGGTQYKPLRMISAARSTSAENIPLIASTTFSMLTTIGKNRPEEVHYFSEAELYHHYQSLHTYPAKTSFKGVNVVLLILESFSKEYIGYYGKDKRFTPFFDSLITQSLSFPNTFANSKKSIEGIPAIVASLPALMEEPFLTSPYNGYRINSLASVLKKEGYYTAFFHGGNNGTMNFDNFAYLAGYDHYYGRREYGPQDYDGYWGVYDHCFYRWFVDKMNTMPQPFFTTLFTLSSHHPFKIPDELAGRLPEGHHPILRTIAYADYSLRTFFEYARKQPWYSNTLFVITADHTGAVLSTEYETRKGIYEIPLLFFLPGIIAPAENHSVAQQCDVMPSILGFLGIEQPFVAFGNNLFDPSQPRFSISYLQGSYQLISDHYLIQFDGTDLLNAFRWRTDPLLKENIFNGNPEPFLQELNWLKSVIQQFNSRILQNRLTPDA
jgi:phosphoglycerol transferase MdoB-like AlkP superfamily enzyme